MGNFKEETLGAELGLFLTMMNIYSKFNVFRSCSVYRKKVDISDKNVKMRRAIRDIDVHQPLFLA